MRDAIISKLKAEGCQSLSLDEIWRCLKGCVSPHMLMCKAIDMVDMSEISLSDISASQKVPEDLWRGATDKVANDIKLSRHKDIILQAINEYDQWMLDDDYDAGLVLDGIIFRMKLRLSMESGDE